MARRCSECPDLLPDGAPKHQKTCSSRCKQRRYRRLKKNPGADASRHPTELAVMQEGQSKDPVREAFLEEVRPIIREEIQDHVLQHVRELVSITPKALERLKVDLDSDDENIRQRAYTLVLRWTMGNPTAAPPPADEKQQPVNIVFNVPRPGDVPSDTEQPAPVEHEAVRTCTDCHTTKPESEFIGASERCTTCYDGIQAQIAERFG